MLVPKDDQRPVVSVSFQKCNSNPLLRALLLELLVENLAPFFELHGSYINIAHTHHCRGMDSELHVIACHLYTLSLFSFLLHSLSLSPSLYNYPHLSLSVPLSL